MGKIIVVLYQIRNMQIKLFATLANLQHSDLLPFSTESVISQATTRYCLYPDLLTLEKEQIIHIKDPVSLIITYTRRK